MEKPAAVRQRALVREEMKPRGGQGASPLPVEDGTPRLAG
jgi:hypothetical protein